MKEIQNKESSPYDNSRNGNPFITKSAGGITGFILVVVLAISFNKYFIRNSHQGQITQPTGSYGMTLGNLNTVKGRGVPASEDKILKEIWSCRNEIGANWANISNQHKIGWQNSNIEKYRKDLLTQITACDKWLYKFQALPTDSVFSPVLDLDREYVMNSRMACKAYLDYVNSRDKSDLDIANNYLESVDEIAKMVQLKFIEILKQHNYNYEIESSGQVRYSVEPSAF